MNKKVVVISGGSDGLGKEIARILVDEYQVIIISPSQKKLEQTATGLGCDSIVCDVSDYTQCQKTVETIISKYGAINTLINNAGVWIEGELDENEADAIKKVMEINCLGTIFLSKAVLPIMKKQKEGRIINIVSQAGLYGKALRTVYTAAKWGITGFTKSLQPELSKYGIGVTGFYPGKMKTALFEKVGYKKDMTDALDPSEAAKAIKLILTFETTTIFPEIGIKHIDN